LVRGSSIGCSRGRGLVPRSLSRPVARVSDRADHAESQARLKRASRFSIKSAGQSTATTARAGRARNDCTRHPRDRCGGPAAIPSAAGPIRRARSSGPSDPRACDRIRHKRILSFIGMRRGLGAEARASPSSTHPVSAGFTRFFMSGDADLASLDDEITFMTSPLFASAYGSRALADLVTSLISIFPDRAAVTNRLLGALAGSPFLRRAVDRVEALPGGFLAQIPLGVRAEVAQAFSESSHAAVAAAARGLCERPRSGPSLDFWEPVVSMCDVFNETVADLERPAAVTAVIERLQPFTVSDVADFIASFSSQALGVDRVLPLLKPLKTVKCSLGDLVRQFDRDDYGGRAELLLPCLKEVTGARVVPANVFLGKWKHPRAQLRLLLEIISLDPVPVAFPKAVQPRFLTPGMVGDLRAEHWMCLEFVETLAGLYDSAPARIEEAVRNGQALLLLVLAGSGRTSCFAEHLFAGLMDSDQRMPGFAAVWATSRSFFTTVASDLMESRRGLIGRLVDLVDDLTGFQEFVAVLPAAMAISMNVAAFFRRGADFFPFFTESYARESDFLSHVFLVFDSPVEFGLNIEMKAERLIHCNGSRKSVSADLRLFEFLDSLYSNTSDSVQAKVRAFFEKCAHRTPRLLDHAFAWRELKPQPLSPGRFDRTDLIGLAVSPDRRARRLFRSRVCALLSMKSDIEAARSSGRTLGKLLARDLIDGKATSMGLRLIRDGFDGGENSAALAFAIAAVDELKDDFDLIRPFARHLRDSAAFRAHAPEAFAATDVPCDSHAAACVPRKPYVVLELNAWMARFRGIRACFEGLGADQTAEKLDACSLGYVKSQMAGSSGAAVAAPFVRVCLEAAAFLVRELITSPDARTARSRCHLARLGRWIGSVTIQKSKPVFSYLLDVPLFIIYGYEQSCLCSAIPFIGALFEAPPTVFMPPSPWTVSILSVLSAIVRIPYLRYSIRSQVLGLFERLGIAPGQVAPYPLQRIKAVHDSDFLYPPVDFSDGCSSRLFECDIEAVFKVVNRRFRQHPGASRIIRDVALFVVTTVPAIAASAAATAFSLVLKDFARCRDSEAVKRHSKALLLLLVNALSVGAVSMVSDPCDGGVDEERRILLRPNARWIDLFVRQLAFRSAWTTLCFELEPFLRMRQVSAPFWDVKSFPMSSAARVPVALWPAETAEQGRYGASDTTESLVAPGLYECFDIEPAVKKVYNGFTVNALAVPVDAASERAIDADFARSIAAMFVIDPQSGEITDVWRGRLSFPSLPPITVVATLVHCFPPWRPKCVREYGASLVREMADRLSQPVNESLRSQIAALLWHQFPCAAVFAELVRRNLIGGEVIDALAMNWIDSLTDDEDLAPLVDVVFERLQSKVSGPCHVQRLAEFLCTTSVDGGMPVRIERLSSLRLAWANTPRREPIPASVERTSHEAAAQLLAKWRHLRRDEIEPFVQSNIHYIVDRKSRFWGDLVTTSFPNGRTELLKIFYASVYFLKEGHSIDVLLNFLREMFDGTINGRISMSYFAAVIGNVFIQLRVYSMRFAMMLGGFLKDTRPELFPRLTGAWIHLFPLAAQTLLLDEAVFPPTAGLVVSLLGVLDRFPADWGRRVACRRLYKAVLRTVLLLVHDAPRFVCGYCFDFVAAVPVVFRVLRNVVLCCRPPQQDVAPMTSFRAAEKEAVLSGDLGECGPLSVAKAGGFFLIAFLAAPGADAKNPLWQLLERMLGQCRTAENATAVVEALFDHVRFECSQTRLFVAVIVRLWEGGTNWDGVTARGVIFSVLSARTRGLEVTPAGLAGLRKKLEACEGFDQERGAD